MLAMSCGTEPVPTIEEPRPIGFNPLALAIGANGNRARNEGRLEITDTCVFLMHRDNLRTLLIWPAAQTDWDPDTGTILFNRRNGDRLQLFHGQNVEVGGSGGGLGHAAPPAQLLDQMSWVKPPMPECGAPEYWWMGDIGPL